MVLHRDCGHFPGDWVYSYDVGTEAEAAEFLGHIKKLEVYKEIIDDVKANNPEVLL